MDALGTALQLERTRTFVGRRNELQRFERWKNTSSPDTAVVFVTGMAGVGKSALLREMAARSGPRTHVVRVDGCACGPSPRRVMEHVALSLEGLDEQPQGAPNPQSAVAARPAGTVEGPKAFGRTLRRLVDEGDRVLIIVDNDDDMRELDSWFREVLCPHLPAQGVWLVIAGRSLPLADWRVDTAWGPRVVHLPLLPLPRPEARELLRRMGIVAPLAIMQTILRSSAGLPLALCTRAAAFRAGGEAAAAQRLSGAGERILREIGDAALVPLVESLAVMVEANQERLATLRGEPVSAHAYHALGSLSFVYGGERGLRIDPCARVHLLAEMRHRNARLVPDLCRRAVGLVAAEWARAEEHHRRSRLAEQLVDLAQYQFPAFGWFADLSATSDLPAPAPAQPNDRARLHELLENWVTGELGLTDTAEVHAYLDLLLANYPEAVRVVHGPLREPLAFAAILPLNMETTTLLSSDAFGQRLLTALPPSDRAALRKCAPHRVDTYCWSVCGISWSSAQPMASPEYLGPEVGARLWRDALTRLGERARLLATFCTPKLAAALQETGLRQRCLARLESYGGSPLPFVVIEADFRERDFGAWVAGFHADSNKGTSVGPPAVVPPIQDIKDALADLHYPQRLDMHPLAQHRGWSGRELAQRLRQILTDPSPAAPLTSDLQLLLRTRFLDGITTPVAAAAALHMSRATFYRRLQRALEAVATALARQR